MEHTDPTLALTPAESDVADTFSRVEAPSSSLDEKLRMGDAVEALDPDGSFYIKGWRLHTLSLRLASLHCHCA